MENRLLVWCAIGATVFALLMAAVVKSQARWNPVTSGISAEQASQYSAWFKTQKMEPGEYAVRDLDEHIRSPRNCCGDEEHAGGDGHYVKVEHRADGYYVFVREFERWVLYPYHVNPDHENPTGQNVAWYAISPGDGPSHKGLDITWYCLRLATGI